jgi:hypothetical protein
MNSEVRKMFNRFEGFMFFSIVMKSFLAQKQLVCAPSDPKQWTVMFRTIAEEKTLEKNNSP